MLSHEIICRLKEHLKLKGISFEVIRIVEKGVSDAVHYRDKEWLAIFNEIKKLAINPRTKDLDKKVLQLLLEGKQRGLIL